ncbi:MAG: hypothetical protein E7356_00780 [Clostridiales bacterium]|nr:hypothetical protein [Clostridiales bacterium]
MREDFIEAYTAFIEKYGIESQMRMCIEEMSELTKELCKAMRYAGVDGGFSNNDAIKEEIADVMNMVEELAYYYGIDDIEEIREYKIDRSGIRG